MEKEVSSLTYFMAAEKVGGLISSIEMLMEFVEEFEIKPDEEVKKALSPGLLKIKEWLK